MAKKRFMGWKKDVRDERDFYSATCPVRTLPDKVDLSAILPVVRDQGQVGSCVGFGVGGNLSGLAIEQKLDIGWFSPTWIYNGARQLEGNLYEDTGCQPRDALEFLIKNGALLEKFLPYNPLKLDTTLPTNQQRTEAAKYPVLSYERVVDGIAGVCSALAAGKLVSIGSPWYAQWMSTDIYGKLAKPSCCSPVAGGHETLLYGYDRPTEYLQGQNSWSTDWGKDGRFWMPFSAISMFKNKGGYDAHIINVTWVAKPEPAT